MNLHWIEITDMVILHAVAWYVRQIWPVSKLSVKSTNSDRLHVDSSSYFNGYFHFRYRLTIMFEYRPMQSITATVETVKTPN